MFPCDISPFSQLTRSHRHRSRFRTIVLLHCSVVDDARSSLTASASCVVQPSNASRDDRNLIQRPARNTQVTPQPGNCFPLAQPHARTWLHRRRARSRLEREPWEASQAGSQHSKSYLTVLTKSGEAGSTPSAQTDRALSRHSLGTCLFACGLWAVPIFSFSFSLSLSQPT